MLGILCSKYLNLYFYFVGFFYITTYIGEPSVFLLIDLFPLSKVLYRILCLSKYFSKNSLSCN